MKRLSIMGAFASIALAALTFASEANAAIKAPPAPPSGVCTQVNSGTGAWPTGTHTYYCHAATQADGMLMYNVLNSYVAGASLNSTEMQNLSAFINRGNFYLYDTPAHFNTDFPGWKQASDTAASLTENDPTTGEPLFSVVFLENNNGTSNDFIQNATAHELGHWVDAIDSAALLNQETITLDGTITTNDKISLTVKNAPFTSVTVSATSSATSTTTTLATALAAAVNANATLKNNGYTATSNGPSIVITFAYATRPVSGPTYSYSVSGAKTETVTWIWDQKRRELRCSGMA